LVLVHLKPAKFKHALVGWNVSLDGAELAQLRSPRFTQTTLGPGSHMLAVNSAASQNKPGEVKFEAKSGEVIVFAMKLGALNNALSFVRELDTTAALRKLSRETPRNRVLAHPDSPAGGSKES
jgi:hypothetical protein